MTKDCFYCLSKVERKRKHLKMFIQSSVFSSIHLDIDALTWPEMSWHTKPAPAFGWSVDALYWKLIGYLSCKNQVLAVAAPCTIIVPMFPDWSHCATWSVLLHHISSSNTANVAIIWYLRMVFVERVCIPCIYCGDTREGWMILVLGRNQRSSIWFGVKPVNLASLSIQLQILTDCWPSTRAPSLTWVNQWETRSGCSDQWSTRLLLLVLLSAGVRCWCCSECSLGATSQLRSGGCTVNTQCCFSLLPSRDYYITSFIHATTNSTPHLPVKKVITMNEINCQCIEDYTWE